MRLLMEVQPGTSSELTHMTRTEWSIC